MANSDYSNSGALEARHALAEAGDASDGVLTESAELLHLGSDHGAECIHTMREGHRLGNVEESIVILAFEEGGEGPALASSVG